MNGPLRVVDPADLAAAGPLPLDERVVATAAAIVADVRTGGEPALRRHAERLGDLPPGSPLVLGRDALAAACARLSDGDRRVLERTAARIRAFAAAQCAALRPVDVAVPGGRAGHEIAAVERAGCYAPGGRYPLPSSVLMTAVTARAAGVAEVWVASPRPADVTLAAAAIAGADGVLCCGGAQAIAALAFGAGPVPRCDVVAGPGNAWVTAAKKLVAGEVAIDMLAGPSELVVLADEHADPAQVAADLLAQAEHDPEARPVLITTSPSLLEAVQRELEKQLATLATADVARASLTAHGRACVVASLEDAAELCDRLAPEHLQLTVADPGAVRPHLHHYGALFLGPAGAEVFGDYGIGPNHVLPTGGTARSRGGLSVLTFLRVRTWLRLDHLDRGLAADVERLAELEGLVGHGEAVRLRRRAD